MLELGSLWHHFRLWWDRAGGVLVVLHGMLEGLGLASVDRLELVDWLRLDVLLWDLGRGSITLSRDAIVHHWDELGRDWGQCVALLGLLDVLLVLDHLRGILRNALIHSLVLWLGPRIHNSLRGVLRGLLVLMSHGGTGTGQNTLVR